MTPTPWKIRLSEAAENDWRRVLAETLRLFGQKQALTYRELLVDALKSLENGPDNRLSRQRDDIRIGFRLLHIARRGRPGRHFIVYRAEQDHTIEIVRILHDAMDLPRHLPED